MLQFEGTHKHEDYETILNVLIDWVNHENKSERKAKIQKAINMRDGKNKDCLTVMHYAISEKWPNKYKIQLLEWGCNIAIKNKDGKYSPLKKRNQNYLLDFEHCISICMFFQGI